nr:D-mannonate oxidoreductase [uncultured bacterium]
MDLANLFNLRGKVAVVAGGAGVLGSAIAEGLAAAGATVSLTNRNGARAKEIAERLCAAGWHARGYVMDALSQESILECCNEIVRNHGHVDVLVNAVGGNHKDATTSEASSFFDLDLGAVRDVVALNLVGGAIGPAMIFGKAMSANSGGGSIIHLSSMAADRPLTRVAGYSASKAAVENFTRWLAVHLAQEVSADLRVNAIAPGFFLTDQNRFLLVEEESGHATERGRKIIDHTPMGRYGEPHDVVGAVVYLASDASRFVTGTVLPIDGGFSAYSGV